jgi:hypothetical protein
MGLILLKVDPFEVLVSRGERGIRVASLAVRTCGLHARLPTTITILLEHNIFGVAFVNIPVVFSRAGVKVD